MNRDLDALNKIQNLSSDEFERFKSAVKILTSKTYIIRGIEKKRELYNFTIRNIALLDAWFLCMDASLSRDESLSVIAFRGSGNNRVFFSREEICAVLVLRLIYEDKKLEVTLTTFTVITITDFQQKYNSVTGDEIRKIALINTLRRLSSCILISIESQDYSDPEGLIKFYPSIPLSLDRSAHDEAVSLLAESDKTEDQNEDTAS
ncbi:MAG: DUF4194 domain-containing protein [Treponema sp.]|nr:DUF4194 domain-containing protein [Treponema sp.]